jgi:hypothetical protein
MPALPIVYTYVRTNLSVFLQPEKRFVVYGI